MASNDHAELISQFKDVTGVETERAQFYLESSAWKLEVALASFYENDETIGVTNEPVPELVDDLTKDNDNQEDDRRTRPIDLIPTSMESKAKTKSKPKPNRRFGTISDLLKKDSSSEEEEGQAFYAGGSEHSGQQVLGPGKKKDIVSDMFKSCQGQSIALEQNTTGQQRPNTFAGTGYKLGQTSSDSEAVSGPSSERERNNGVISLKLWREGFTINDRELRSYHNPSNREFLAAIKRGEIPEEIRQEIQGAEVRLNMEDHHHEEYVPPKVKVKAFTGKGHMLGSPSPATVGMTLSTDPADQAANEAEANRQLNLDPNNSVTTLQIRLEDGTNVKVQFNLTHTINDIRRFIITMRPQYAVREFNLFTMYPTKELNEDKTIEEAGLQNSVIMQRLK